MKVLITGASGLLGRPLMKAFEGAEVLGLALSRAGGALKRVDITDRDAVDEAVRTFGPDVIVHSAAMRKPDICQNDQALTYRINVDATARIAESARACGAWVLYLSTDYVFDGTAPPYDVDDAPNPLNVYAKSKLGGERALLDRMPHCAVLRVPILYGPVEELAESAVTVIAEQVLSKAQSTIDAWAVRYPTHVEDVARACLLLARAWSDGSEEVRRGGVFHFSGDEPMTKSDMARVIGEILGVATSHVAADAAGPGGTPRPRNCHLNCSRIEQLFELRKTPFRGGMAKILAPHAGRRPC